MGSRPSRSRPQQGRRVTLGGENSCRTPGTISCLRTRRFKEDVCSGRRDLNPRPPGPILGVEVVSLASSLPSTILFAESPLTEASSQAAPHPPSRAPAGTKRRRHIPILVGLDRAALAGARNVLAVGQPMRYSLPHVNHHLNHVHLKSLRVAKRATPDDLNQPGPASPSVHLQQPRLN